MAPEYAYEAFFLGWERRNFKKRERTLPDFL